MFTVDQRLLTCIHTDNALRKWLHFRFLKHIMIYAPNLSFNGGNDCISEFVRISTFHGIDSKWHWSTFYGNDCISDSKLRSVRKSFTEMIAFSILKYNNHNTVTLCGNDCISDFQWLLCTYMIRFQFFITFCCHFQIRLSWHYYAYFRMLEFVWTSCKILNCTKFS